MPLPTDRRLRILLTNDDGPPSGTQGHSPFIWPFAKALVDQLNADVRVVVPAVQQSWQGKAYRIGEKVKGCYFYPDPNGDGTTGEQLPLPKRAEERKEGELEFILLQGTPATCASIALHNLFSPDSFDVVLSGPNFGRNTSTAFALSSGTLGAALSACISGAKAIAVSYGIMEGYKPPAPEFVTAAVDISCKIVRRLVELGWGEGEDRVDVYSVNVPLMPEIVSNPQVRWTSMAQTRYGRLFKSSTESSGAATPNGLRAQQASSANGGPAAVPEPKDASEVPPKKAGEGDEDLLVRDEHYERELHFKFEPDIRALVNPNPDELVEGTDKHCIHSGIVSVTPVLARFAEAPVPQGIPLDGLSWKM
ncbi:hypothetical protein JCM10207_002317 [Rhodosporidiobolus poonsookiae]